MTGFVQIATTIDDEEGARMLAHHLVAGHWAACVQVVGPIESTYQWEGRVETAREWQCLIKAREDRFADIVTAIREIHPYETPEIVAVPISMGSDKYLAWLHEVLEEKNHHS